MKINKVRGFLAIIIVTSIMLVISLIALEPLLIGSKINMELLKTWSSIWSGVLGIILGYYFGKRDDESKEEKD